MKVDKIIGFIIIGMILGFVLILISSAYDEYKIYGYCEEHGYDGKDSDNRCYKEIPHESGHGTYKEYTGVITKDNIK